MPNKIRSKGLTRVIFSSGLRRNHKKAKLIRQ